MVGEREQVLGESFVLRGSFGAMALTLPPSQDEQHYTPAYPAKKARQGRDRRREGNSDLVVLDGGPSRPKEI